MRGQQPFVINASPVGCSWLPAFLIGVAVGAILGWAFHGVVGLILTLGILAPLLLLAAFIVYGWWNGRTSAAKPGDGTIAEADWREIDPRGGGRGTW